MCINVIANYKSYRLKFYGYNQFSTILRDFSKSRTLPGIHLGEMSRVLYVNMHICSKGLYLRNYTVLQVIFQIEKKVLDIEIAWIVEKSRRRKSNQKLRIPCIGFIFMYFKVKTQTINLQIVRILSFILH